VGGGNFYNSTKKNEEDKLYAATRLLGCDDLKNN
jgi:hypothetical protein